MNVAEGGRLRLLAGLLLVGPSMVWAAPQQGSIKVAATVDDEAAAGCTIKAYAAGSTTKESPEVLAEGSGDEVSVPAQKLDVLVECPKDGASVGSLVKGVGVKPGAKATVVTVKMEKAALIVHGVHGDSRVSKGEITLRYAGTFVEAGRAPVGSRVTVSAGNYDVHLETEVDGEPVVVLEPGQAVKAGRPQVLSLNVSHGLLKLVVLRNGKPAEGGGAVTFPGQQGRIKEFSTGDPVPVSPGTYDVLGSLQSSFDFKEQRTRKVTVTPGKITEVVMNFPRGTVSTHCMLDGKEAVGTVYGYLPGAAEDFNKAPCGQVLELSPGKYHLKLVLDAEASGYKILGGGPAPEVWHRNVSVDKSSSKDAKADFSPSRIKVVAKKNNVETEAAITIIKPGGPVLGGGPSGQELPIPPGRWDVEVLFPLKRGPAKELVRGVECQASKVCTVGINLERATLMVEVFQGGQPKPDAEVVLYKEGSDIPYVKGKSGEDLEVPPGDWVPEVRAGQAKRQVNKMRLRAGDRETRKVELE
jgi:hypothetical protein